MYDIDFIKYEDLKKHIRDTISKYEDTLKAINLRKFNKNVIDPIKFTFDSKVYKKEIEQIIIEELARQRDKTNTNVIGYFHQNIFKYIDKCSVPAVGWDVIVQNGNKTIYVEMKNKHNTMNSSSSSNTYAKMQNKIMTDLNAECYLVEAIAKHSQNIMWKKTIDHQVMQNERIRRVSMDKFYEIVTGDKKAFFKLCKILPEIIDEIVAESDEYSVGKDTVIEELKKQNTDVLKALYLLAFKEYEGFNEL